IFISLILGAVALRRTGNLKTQLAGLRRELIELRDAMPKAAEVEPPATSAPPISPSPASPPLDSSATERPTEPEPAPETAAPEPEAVRPTIEPAVEPAPAMAAASSGGPSRLGLERNLTGRWTIWLGAVTLALSGVFLVKYSIEQDLL